MTHLYTAHLNLMPLCIRFNNLKKFSNKILVLSSFSMQKKTPFAKQTSPVRQVPNQGGTRQGIGAMLAGPVLADVVKRMKGNLCNWGCWETSNSPSTNRLLFPINSVGTTLLGGSLNNLSFRVFQTSEALCAYRLMFLESFEWKKHQDLVPAFIIITQSGCAEDLEKVWLFWLGGWLAVPAIPIASKHRNTVYCLKCCSLNHRIHIASCFGTSVNCQLLNFPRKNLAKVHHSIR